MELLYRVNSEDQVEGSVERGRAHQEGILHRSGIVFLKRSDGAVLIQHRSPSKSIFPACYDVSAAFHVMFGETYEQAATRELQEETGVSAEVAFLGKFLHHDPPEHQFVGVFGVSSDAPIRIDPAESAGYEFLMKAGVDRLVRDGRVTPWLRSGWPLARDRL